MTKTAVAAILEIISNVNVMKTKAKIEHDRLKQRFSKFSKLSYKLTGTPVVKKIIRFRLCILDLSFKMNAVLNLLFFY